MQISGSMLTVAVLLCAAGCLVCMCSGGNDSSMRTGFNACSLSMFLLCIVFCAMFFKSFAKDTPAWILIGLGALAALLCCTPSFVPDRSDSSSSNQARVNQPPPAATAAAAARAAAAQANEAQIALLKQIWVTFFNSCLERGLLEVRDNRLSKEWIEDVDPRVILALPSIIILQCIFDSQKSNGVVLPDGTEVSSSSKRSLPIPADVCDRLLAAKAEFKKLGTLTDAEKEYLELRSLQVDDPPALANAERQAQINRAASTIEAAATSVTQSSVYSTMEQVLNQMQARLGVA